MAGLVLLWTMVCRCGRVAMRLSPSVLSRGATSKTDEILGPDKACGLGLDFGCAPRACVGRSISAECGQGGTLAAPPACRTGRVVRAP